MNEPWREIVLAEARSWLRTPFLNRQRCKGRGVDCANLVCAAIGAVIPGVPTLEELPEYGTDWWQHTESGEICLPFLERFLYRCEDREAGNVASFRMGRKQHAHLAIITGWPIVLVAAPPMNGVVEAEADREPFLRGRLTNIWTVKHELL